MKKIIKKLVMLSMLVCAMLSAPAIVGYAADGTLSFSDPTGKVGEEIAVKVKIESGGLPIGDGKATISYDKTKLEFVGGANATAGDGTVELFASGTGTETELVFELTFKALAEGDTTIQATSSEAYLFSDETLNLTNGTSAVKIEAGDGNAEGTGTSGNSGEREVSEANIEVKGSMYGIYENFTDALIPAGFSKTTISYNGAEHNAIKQDSSGTVMVFLVTGSNDPVMALYEEADSSFVIAEPVTLSEEASIFILGESDETKLPEQFQDTIMEINGTEFPAWQNVKLKDYFLVFALSSDGTEGYYQYDSVEGTYQRYVIQEAEKKEETTAAKGMIGKIQGIVDQYFLIVAAVVLAVVLILLIVLIVLAVKLRSRNAELDELYDEYDEEDEDDYGEDEESIKRNRKRFAGFEEDEEGYDDLDEEFIENDAVYEDDYYEDDDYDEYDDAYDEYDDEDEYEDYDDDREKKGDKYDVDFIDL